MHKANITSGDKKKYFALQGTYKSYRGGQRVSPSKGNNSSPVPDLPFCLSACLDLCCLFVACLCPLSVFNLFVSVRPSVCPSILHNVITNKLSFFLSFFLDGNILRRKQKMNKKLNEPRGWLKKSVLQLQ